MESAAVELRELVINEHTVEKKSPDTAASFTDKTIPRDHRLNKQVDMDIYCHLGAIRISLRTSLCA
jgi:hypothetical protein